MKDDDTGPLPWRCSCGWLTTEQQEHEKTREKLRERDARIAELDERVRELERKLSWAEGYAIDCRAAELEACKERDKLRSAGKRGEA